MQNKSMYHNTKKLLEHYTLMKYPYITRSGTLDYEYFKEAQESGCSVNDLIAEAESLNMEAFRGEYTMKEQIKWLDFAIRYINANMELLKTYPEKGKIYYDLIESRYLRDERERPNAIMERLSISRQTYQRWMQSAITELGNLLWCKLQDSTVEKIMQAASREIIVDHKMGKRWHIE